ncbi:MAG: DUF448 domain-containing protein [Acidimicrobiales bacterium]
MGCRQVRSTEGLMRVVRGGDGELGRGAGAPGRGAWLCTATRACTEQAARRQAFGRAFRAPVTSGAVDRLCSELWRDERQGGGLFQVCEDGGTGRVAGPRPEEEGS